MEEDEKWKMKKMEEDEKWREKAADRSSGKEQSKQCTN